MTPSLEIGNGNWAVKSDSLLGYKTIDGKYYPREIGVTRATTATRINADGLVELTPYNLLTYSVLTGGGLNVTPTGWSQQNTTGNYEPFGNEGGSISYRFWATSGRRYLVNSNTLASGSSYAFSFYVDSVDIITNLGSIYLPVQAGSTITNIKYYVDNVLVSSSTNITANTRVKVTFDCTSAGVVLHRFGGGVANNATYDFVMSRPQFVEGTEPLDYLPTTDRLDIARIDYSSGDAALLVEPQRTNLALYSQQFDNAAWFTGGGTVTPNFATSPSGLTDAELVNGNLYQNANLTIGATYTLSVWAKLYSINAPFYLFANYFSSYQQYILFYSEYQRVSFTFTATQSFNAFGFSGSDVLIYGAQLEAGAYATSYIPTTSASVTRNVDLTVEKNITSFGIGNSYTLLFDLTMATEDSNKILFTLKNSSGTNSITFRNFNNNLRIYDTIGSSYPLASLPNESTKWAFRFDGVNYSLFRVSGGVAVKDTATLGTARDIGYFSEINSGQTKASIKYFSIYPSALSDTECEQFVMS